MWPPVLFKNAGRYLDLMNNSFVGTKSGNWRENMIDETRLSLGDVYTHREDNISRRSHCKSAYVWNNGTEHLQWPVGYPTSKIVPKSNPLSTDGPSNLMRNLPQWLREEFFPSPEPAKPTLRSTSQLWAKERNAPRISWFRGKQ